MRMKQVVVIGSSDDATHSDEARAIGKFIARNGWALITGGRGGIMEAASRGAADAGGLVIGILPGESPDEANPYCTAVIPTGMGFARNAVNVLSADVIVAIAGRSGTLSELAFARIYGKPVICCAFAGGWSAEFPRTFIDDREGAGLYTAGDVGEVCSLLSGLLKN